MSFKTGIPWLDATVYLVSALGFPIAVTGFLLWERMTIVQNLTLTLTELRIAIGVLSSQLGQGATITIQKRKPD